MSPRKPDHDPSNVARSHATRLGVELGSVVRDERLARGWTQRDLAEKAGLSAATVCHIESGDIRPIETYARLAAVLALRPEFHLVDPRRKRGGARRDEDPVHAAMGEIEAAHFRSLGFDVSLDEPFQHYQFAGRADLIAWSVGSRALLHVENRTRFPNIGETFGSYNAKRAYLAGALASRLGLRQGFDSVTHAIVALWSAETLHTLRLRTQSFRSVCPAPTEAFDRWWSGVLPATGIASTLVIFDPVDGERSTRRRYVGLEELQRVRPRHSGYAAALEALRTVGRA